MDLQQTEVKTKRKKSPVTYYYVNQHDKVISLTEEVAYEQHNLHKKYLGSSKDLDNTGFSVYNAIREHLESNVDNPAPPPDRRRVGDVPQGNQQLREQIKQEILQELNANKKEQKSKD